MAGSDFVISGTTLEKYVGKSRTVIIPKGVTSIGDKAFYGCKGIDTIELPDTVTSIGVSAFEMCSLSFVRFSSNLKIIGKRAFYSCENLKDIAFPASVTHIGEAAFDMCPLYSVYIPTTVKRVGVSAFANCDLGKVMVAGKDTIVERAAFARFWKKYGFCWICGDEEFYDGKCFRCNKI